MFTGIVEEKGEIVSILDTADGRRLTIGAAIIREGIALGDSIAVSGTCLTVVAVAAHTFTVEVTRQTLRMTKLGDLKQGSSVNLERSLKLQDRLGGHLVTGHIDGVGRIIAIAADGFSRLVSFEVEQKLSAYFIEKGSVAVDGISLTVASLEAEPGKCRFTCALIPHTLSVTTAGMWKVDDKVNIEADLIAKYVARWVEPSLTAKVNKPGLTAGFLSEHGYT